MIEDLADRIEAALRTRADPDLARKGIRLRSFGQSVIEAIAGRKVHAPGIVPGGIAHPMTAETSDMLKAGLDESHGTILAAIEIFTGILDQFEREVDAFGRFPSLFMGLANHEGTWEHYDGTLRVVDHDGAVLRRDHADVAAQALDLDHVHVVRDPVDLEGVHRVVEADDVAAQHQHGDDDDPHDDAAHARAPRIRAALYAFGGRDTGGWPAPARRGGMPAQPPKACFPCSISVLKEGRACRRSA